MKRVAEILPTALPLRQDNIRLSCCTKNTLSCFWVLLHVWLRVLHPCWDPRTRTDTRCFVYKERLTKMLVNVTDFVASQVAVSIETDKVCTVASLSVWMSHTIILQTGVGGQAPTAGVFLQCSTELCLHIAALRGQKQLPSEMVFSVWFKHKGKTANTLLYWRCR